MGILYGTVARNHVVLAEFSSTKTNASAVARQIFEKIKEGNGDCSASYCHDRFIFHVKRTDGLTVLCMADDLSGRIVPFAFMEEVRQRFVKTYGQAIASASAYAMNDEFSRVLGQVIDQYSNNPNAVGKLNHLKEEMSQVRVVVIDNIEKVLGRGDCLALLVEKTTTLQGNAFQFRRQTHHYKKTVWWSNIKLKGAFLFVLSVVLYIVLACVCRGPLLVYCMKKLCTICSS